MAINRGLGKGLSALFSDTDAEYEYSSVQNEKYINNEKENAAKTEEPFTLPLDKIFANPNQPRKNFDREALNELTQSVKEHGIVQPLIVSKNSGRYMIIAGERRFRAALSAGLKSVPVVVKNYTDKEIKEISLIENLQREDLNPVEAAFALKQLMDEYNLTQDELARRIGKSRPAIANLLRLLSLPSNILDMVRDKKLSEGHARCLVGLDSGQAQEIAQKAAGDKLSVREIEKAVKAFSLKNNKININKPVAGHSRELKELVYDMQRVFGTSVTAVGTENKGRIYIDYYTKDDLNRIYDITEKLKKH